MENFETITIGHTDGLFDKRVLNADMVEDSGSDWGIIQIRTTRHAPCAFFRLFQMDRCFAMRGEDDKSDMQYAQLTMIVCKKYTVPPKDEFGECYVEYAYLNSDIQKAASVSARINAIRAGDYIVLYKVDWKSDHTCRKLNLAFYGTRDLVMGAKVQRVDPDSYRRFFFKDMMRRHEDRVLKGAHYEQPKV